MRNPWAREYAKTPDRYIWGKAPSRFARELTAFVPPGGRILDLGCGTEAEMLHQRAVALVSRPVNDLPREISACHHRDNPGSNRVFVTGRTGTACR